MPLGGSVTCARRPPSGVPDWPAAERYLADLPDQRLEEGFRRWCGAASAGAGPAPPAALLRAFALCGLDALRQAYERELAPGTAGARARLVRVVVRWGSGGAAGASDAENAVTFAVRLGVLGALDWQPGRRTPRLADVPADGLYRAA